MRQEADMEGHDAQEKEAQWNKKNTQGVRVGQDREEQGQLLACRLAIMIADWATETMYKVPQLCVWRGLYLLQENFLGWRLSECATSSGTVGQTKEIVWKSEYGGGHAVF